MIIMMMHGNDENDDDNYDDDYDDKNDDNDDTDDHDDDDNDGSADCIGLMILIITDMMITMLIIKTVIFSRFMYKS